MDPNRAVQELYEQFPYPRPEPDLTEVLAGRAMPAWNPGRSFSLYFPERAPSDRLEVLIAGCGANTAQQHAAFLPNMHFVGIDLAEGPLAHARRVAAQHGLTNVEFHQLPIERVGELGRSFDFVSCHGVLHHLEDPVRGLRALASVTRPDGALSLMVYGKYGRVGLYMLQALFRDRLKLEVGTEDLTTLQAVLQALPEAHPFRIVHQDRARAVSLEEIADMLLHPRDRGYGVDDVRGLVEGAGLQFQRWLGQGQYAPELSPLWGPLRSRFEPLDDRWQRWAAMELYYATIIKHEFVVTHPGRPAHEALFAGAGLEDAVPSLSAHIAVARAGDSLVLTNTQHQVPLRTSLPLTSAVLLRSIDGTRRVRDIAALAAQQGAWPGGTPEDVFRPLHLADLIDLRRSRDS